MVPNGAGAHLVERSNIRGRKGLSMYDRADTPRYYPSGTPESAGQAHIRLHEATRNEGIKLRGGNAGMTDQQLIDSYASAYSSSDISNISGDLRTPDSSNVIAKDVSPSEAFTKLLEWGEQQKGNK